jgi:hypothetical protein
MSRILLLAAAVGCAAIGAHQLPYWLAAVGPLTAGLMAAGTGVCALLLAYVGWRGRSTLARRSAVELVLLGVALLAVEGFVTAVSPGTWTQNPLARQTLTRAHTAQKLGVPFDERTISEVVHSLRKQGVDALPGISRAWARLPDVRSHLAPGFYPLSHASYASVVECNEAGEYFIYQTDELGLHNPRGLLLSGRIDIAVVGESYALGHCVPASQGIVNLIRNVYPRTANLGLADTRSLSQLASFREYVEPLKPPIVLWTVNPGFAVDRDEATHPVLARYLDPTFSQGLLDRQDEVDAAVRTLAMNVQVKQDRALREELRRARAQRFAEAWKLPLIRQRLGLGGRSKSRVPIDFSVFGQSLQLARDAVGGWGGHLIVVVLPNRGYLVGERPEVLRHDGVLRTVRALGVPLIDGAAVFSTHPEAARLFSLGALGHPNAEGNRLLARHIVKQIEQLKGTPTETTSPRQTPTHTPVPDTIEEIEREFSRAAAENPESIRPGFRSANSLFSVALTGK